MQAYICLPGLTCLWNGQEESGRRRRRKQQLPESTLDPLSHYDPFHPTFGSNGLCYTDPGTTHYTGGGTQPLVLRGESPFGVMVEEESVATLSTEVMKNVIDFKWKRYVSPTDRGLCLRR